MIELFLEIANNEKLLTSFVKNTPSQIFDRVLKILIQSKRQSLWRVMSNSYLKNPARRSSSVMELSFSKAAGWGIGLRVKCFLMNLTRSVEVVFYRTPVNGCLLFLTNFPISYPLKTPENQRFSFVLREWKMDQRD